MNGVDQKAKGWVVALGMVAFALVSVDYIVLKGEPVATDRVNLYTGSEPVKFSIVRTGEEHLVEIQTRRVVNLEKEGLAINYRLIAPNGSTVVEESEIVSRKTRFFDFVPSEAGEYELYAGARGGRGSASVTVTVGDRRFLSRFVGFF